VYKILDMITRFPAVNIGPSVSWLSLVFLFTFPEILIYTPAFDTHEAVW